MPTEKTPTEKTPSPTFDQRLARLEALVHDLESGDLGLEPAIERYQEGVALLRECRALLDGYKRRVEELTEGGGLAPYAHDPDEKA